MSKSKAKTETVSPDYLSPDLFKKYEYVVESWFDTGRSLTRTHSLVRMTEAEVLAKVGSIVKDGVVEKVADNKRRFYNPARLLYVDVERFGEVS